MFKRPCVYFLSVIRQSKLMSTTQPSPPKKQALPSLEKKLKNAGLVQESLRNLLVQTEDVVDPADTDLLGAIVNCESTTHPRKKWKVSKSRFEV